MKSFPVTRHWSIYSFQKTLPVFSAILSVDRVARRMRLLSALLPIKLSSLVSARRSNRDPVLFCSRSSESPADNCSTLSTTPRQRWSRTHSTPFCANGCSIVRLTVIALATGAALTVCGAKTAAIAQGGGSPAAEKAVSSFASSSATSGATFWKFEGVGYYYEEDGSFRVAVRFHGKDFLWVPGNEILEKFHTDGLEKLRHMDILGLDPTTLTDGTILRGFFSTDCGGRDFADPLLVQIIEDDRKVGGFYILTRRQPPEDVFRELPGGQDCYDTDHQERMYRKIGRSALVGTTLHLPDDSVLFFNLYDSYVVKLEHAPRAALAFGGNLFFVPEADVQDGLAKAGPDLHRRYAVFLRAVAGARLVQPTVIKEATQ